MFIDDARIIKTFLNTAYLEQKLGSRGVYILTYFNSECKFLLLVRLTSYFYG